MAEVVAGLQAVRNLDLLGRGGLFFYSHLHDQLRLGREYVREHYGSALGTDRVATGADMH